MSGCHQIDCGCGNVGKDLKNYQTQAARANYLCLDRPDIGFAVREAMRRLAAPTREDEVAL